MLFGTLLWSYRSDKYFFQSKCDFENASEFWNYDSAHLTDESAHSGKYSFVLDSTREFSATFSAKINVVADSFHREIFASVSSYLYNEKYNPLLVISIEKMSGESIQWKAMNFKRFVAKEKLWQKVFLSATIPEIQMDEENIIVKVYVWNINRENLLIDDMEISVKKKDLIALYKTD